MIKCVTKDTSGFSIARTPAKRLKESMAKWQDAIDKDLENERNKPSGLPSDWMNRVLR